ncbi:MAG: polysaccharide deacetylase family protein [Clostridia bacterium]|nr:polysaccharide deacetylase family protein [Clostridia bacterium]
MKKNKLYYLVCDLLILIICFVVFFVAFKSNDPIFASNENKAIYNGNKNNKNVSLMINVYWGTEYMEDMMDILLEKKASATFFVGGSWTAMNTSMLQKICGNGFEIGSHGYSHLEHDKIDYQKNYDEIFTTHKIVKVLTGLDMSLFAPPSGAYNNTTLQACKDLNYNTIMWSKDTIDWRDQNPNLIFNRATKNLQNGDLILMHPTKATLTALPNIIDTIQNEGFCLTTVSENIFG